MQALISRNIMQGGLLAAIQAAGQNKNLRKVQPAFKQVSLDDDLSLALQARKEGKMASEVAADAAKRAEPLEHKIDRLAKEIARDQVRVNALKAMSQDDREKEAERKKKERDEKNAKLIHEAETAITAYKAALTSFRKTARSVREALMGVDFDEESEVTDEMRSANPELSNLLNSVLIKIQETSKLRADLEGFVKNTKKVDNDTNKSVVSDEHLKLEKAIRSAMKKLESAVDAFNKSTEDADKHKDAAALVANAIANLSKAKTRFAGLGSRDKNAIDPLQQKIDKAVEMLAAAEEQKEKFIELVPNAVDTQAAEDSAELISELRRKLAEAEAKLARHQDPDKSSSSSSSSRKRRNSDSDSEENEQNVEMIRSRLNAALSLAGSAHKEDLETLVASLKSENSRLSDENRALHQRDVLVRDLEKRTIIEMENHRVAALKLQKDATKLKSENDGLLAELERRRASEADLEAKLSERSKVQAAADKDLAALRTRKNSYKSQAEDLKLQLQAQRRINEVVNMADNSRLDAAAEAQAALRAQLTSHEREVNDLRSQLDAERQRYTISRMLGGISSSIESVLKASGSLRNYAIFASGTLTGLNMIASIVAPQHALLSNTTIGYGLNLGNVSSSLLFSALHSFANTLFGETRDSEPEWSAVASCISTMIYTAGMSYFSGLTIPSILALGIGGQLVSFASGDISKHYYNPNYKSEASILYAWGAIAAFGVVDLLARATGGGFSPLSHFGGAYGSAAGVVGLLAPIHLFTANTFADRYNDISEKAFAFAGSALTTAAIAAAFPSEVAVPAVVVGANVVAFSMAAAIQAHQNGYSR